MSGGTWIRGSRPLRAGFARPAGSISSNESGGRAHSLLPLLEVVSTRRVRRPHQTRGVREENIACIAACMGAGDLDVTAHTVMHRHTYVATYTEKLLLILLRSPTPPPCAMVTLLYSMATTCDLIEATVRRAAVRVHSATTRCELPRYSEDRARPICDQQPRAARGWRDYIQYRSALTVDHHAIRIPCVPTATALR